MSASDVLITPVWVWQSQAGTARVYEDVAFGAAWPNWKRLGYTSSPLSINLEREKVNKMVEQARTKIGSVVSAENLTLETTLAELTMENLALAWGGQVTKTPAGSQAAYETLKGGGQICLKTLQWGFEGLYQNEACTIQLPLRFFCIGEAEMGAQLTFGKSEQTGIPLRVEGSFDFATGLLYEWIKVTEPATS